MTENVKYEPMTEDTEFVYHFTEKFKTALNATLGTLGYNTPVGSLYQYMQVHEIFELVNNHLVGKTPMTGNVVDQIAHIIGFAPYNIISGVMADLHSDGFGGLIAVVRVVDDADSDEPVNNTASERVKGYEVADGEG